jgi:hypothetical protein
MCERDTGSVEKVGRYRGKPMSEEEQRGEKRKSKRK